MSRIGKKPILIPEGVTVQQDGNNVHVKGPKGELFVTIHPTMKIIIDQGQIIIERPSDSIQHKSLHGLSRTLIMNAVTGVKTPYVKQLDVQGVGFKANLQGSTLVLNLGFSHPIEFTPPKGITITLGKENKNIVCVEGPDKELVGEISARIRKFRKPEPYKGKGIRYVGEHVRRKAGKSGVSK